MTDDAAFHLNVGPVTRQNQIKAHIVGNILSGVWPPAHRIPSEHELVSSLGVSRMTVHHALRELSNQGYLVRVQGLGTFVAPPRSHLTIVKQLNIADEIKARGGSHRAMVVTREVRKPTAQEMKLMNMTARQDVFHTVVLHFEDNVPLQIEDRLVNTLAAPDAHKQDLTTNTLFDHLMQLYPYPTGSYLVQAFAPDKDVQELLQMADGEPCLEVQRTTSAHQKIVTFVRLVYPATRYRITGEIHPEASALSGVVGKS
jgi:GntR family transcriptional regulator, histidine utilization repressor